MELRIFLFKEIWNDIKDQLSTVVAMQLLRCYLKIGKNPAWNDNRKILWNKSCSFKNQTCFSNNMALQRAVLYVTLGLQILIYRFMNSRNKRTHEIKDLDIIKINYTIFEKLWVILV